MFMRKMTREEFRQLKMNTFVMENANVHYNIETGVCTVSVYFEDERLETALVKGYGFQEI